MEGCDRKTIQPDDFICDEIRDVRTAFPVHCSTRSEETVEKRPRAAHPQSAEA
jgi:hypothetical protein